MTDEPEQSTGDGRPKFFNSVTGWIGGITAVVLALAGLKAATGQLDLFGSDKGADAAATSTENTEEAVPADETAAAELPSKYTGTWENKDVVLEFRNGIWVETTAGGTDDEIVTHYEQLSRNSKTTNAIDRNRNLFVRWPTDGGTLEESEDAKNWTESYDVTAE